jgi:hypothetical protein
MGKGHAMQLKFEIKGLEKVQEQLKRLSQSGIKEAASNALNDTAFKARKTVQDKMQSVFQSPTPYILRSVQVTKSTPESLEATVMPTYMGGKGVDPQKILRSQAEGGPRRDKRSEKLLRSAGILPNGFQTSIPKDPFPGSDDGRGNLRGPFLVQLISYFQAFTEVGHKANMTKKRKDKLANRGVTPTGYKTINGFVYFVSYGRLRSGPTAHLAPGVWAKRGIHGSDVKPVLMFVRAPSYSPRLSMEEIAQKAGLQAEFEKKLRYHIRTAVEKMDAGGAT